MRMTKTQITPQQARQSREYVAAIQILRKIRSMEVEMRALRAHPVLMTDLGLLARIDDARARLMGMDL